MLKNVQENWKIVKWINKELYRQIQNTDSLWKCHKKWWKCIWKLGNSEMSK